MKRFLGLFLLLSFLQVSQAFPVGNFCSIFGLEKFRSKFENSFSALKSDHRLDALVLDLESKASSYIEKFRNPNTSHLAKKLVQLDWFKERGDEEKIKIFFLLNLTNYELLKSTHPDQKELLKNTLAHVYSGRIKFRNCGDHIPCSAGKINGLSHGNGEISLGEFKLKPEISPDEIGEEPRYLATSTLAHEVHHELSGIMPSVTTDYFWEEVVAWQIGFLAFSGRNPTKFEMLRHMDFLLTHKEHYEILNPLLDSYSSFNGNPTLKSISHKLELDERDLSIHDSSESEIRYLMYRFKKDNNSSSYEDIRGSSSAKRHLSSTNVDEAPTNLAWRGYLLNLPNKR